MNTLMGFCSRSRVLDANRVSQLVLGSCPYGGLQELASPGAWQHPGCFLAPVQGGGDLAGDILGLKRNSPPTRAWLSSINTVRARATAIRFPPLSIHLSMLSQLFSSPGTHWPFGSVVLRKVSADINLPIFFFFWLFIKCSLD